MPYRKTHLRRWLTIALLVLPTLTSTQRSAEATLASPQEKAEKKALPPAKWSRTRKIDVKHIALELRFDWSKKQAYGTTAVTLAPLQATKRITLDAGMLTINAITLANGTPLTFAYDGSDQNDALAIMLDRQYQPGEDLTVKIDYRTNWVNQLDPNSMGGNNGKGLRFSAPTSNDPKKPREIWSIGEPESNRYWFPSYDAPNDLRTTEFTATVDNKLTVISNGKLLATKDNADGTRTFHWKMDTPYANHLTSFVVGAYVDVKQTYAGVELHNFGYPNETAATAASVERLPDMIKFFSEKTGVKYPYPSYAQVFVQDLPNWSGNCMTSTITENMVDDAPTHADFFYLWDLTEAEALAQQWFGSYLTARDWSHLWLNKAFPRFLSGLYDEYKNGRAEFLLFQHQFDHTTYLNDWNAGSRQPLVTRHYDNAVAFSADNYPYYRGAAVLQMLRKHLGDEFWWRAVQRYLNANANQTVTTEDFSRAIEAATGESMDWFFDQWVYKMGHPIFEVTKRYEAAQQQLTLHVRQTQKVDANNEYPQAAFFQGKVEIEIDGRIEQVWLQAKAENVFTFAATQEPRLVNFDYESTWIKELKFEKSLDELLYQLQNDKDVLGQNWALGELVKLAKHEQSAAADKARILTGLRQTAGSNAYWRLRLGALSQLQGLLAPFGGTKAFALDDATISLLLTIINHEKSWLRASAIGFLGMTRDPKFADVYLTALNDSSFRVINSAAIALGKSKSPKAFEALAILKDKPSMKSQSLISALAGLKELADPRGLDIAFKALSDLRLLRWRLPTPPVWDYRVFAADTLAALGKGTAAYPMISERFKKSLAEDDLEGIFYNIVLITKLADPRGQEAFDLLKSKFKNDTNALQAIGQFELQFKDALKQPVSGR